MYARPVRILIAVILALFAGHLACRSLPSRWETYEGCTADQCQSWFEGCEADCLKKKRGTVATCQSLCGRKIESCRLACGG